MEQPTLDNNAQTQENLVKNTNVSGNLVFAPIQTEKYIETEIIQISVAKVTQRELIKKSPYQGLKRFNFKDRDRFFGRDKLIARLFNAVNRSPLSLVLGASGSGKSSAVRAGLISELRKSLESSNFYDFIFTPHEDPFESFYRCLLSEEKEYNFNEKEVKNVRQGKSNTLPIVIDTLKEADEKWLIFVDQFEQLFSDCHDIEKRNNFIESLVRVANSEDNSVKIILAMRADFLEQLSSYPALGAIANENNIHLVTDMHPDELRQAIEQPAAKHGVVFEEGLVEQIIKEVEGQKGYLPLLQYTLDLLWQTECKIIAADGHPHIEDRTLNKKNYDTLEGVRGALQKRVNKIYDDLDQDEQLATKQIFAKLVNIVDTDSGSKTVSRRANRSEFVGELVNNTLQTFIDENLLVSSAEDLSSEKIQVSESESIKQSATVEMAHEILLSSWDKLKSWIEEEKEAIILKNFLAGETKRWQKISLEDKSKARQELLKGSRLEQAIDFKKNSRFDKIGGLRAEEMEFINISVAEKKAQKQRNRRIFWGFIVGSLGAVVISSSFGLMARYQAKQAELNLADSMGRNALSLLAEGKDLEAFVEAIKAGNILKKHKVKVKDPQVMAALINNIYNADERNCLQGHQGFVYSVRISPNGQTLASGSLDQTVKLWNLQTGELIRTLQGHQDAVNSVSFSSDGQTLASGSLDGTVKLWNLQTGELMRTLQGHQHLVLSVSISPDGQTLASGGNDKTVKLWNLQTGEPIRTLQGHQHLVESVSFSPDGQTLASGSYDETVKLWNLQTGEEILTLQGHQYGVSSVSFSPDGQTLASGSGDDTVKLWDRQTGEEILTLHGHQDWVSSVSFSPDGQTLASGSGDDTVKLWDRQTGEEILTLHRHQDAVSSVSFSPDGQTLASGSGDDTVKLWNLQTGELIPTLHGHQDAVSSVSFSPDDQTLASGSSDNTVKLWNLQTGELIRTLHGHQDWVSSVSFSPDGQTLASGSGEGTVKLWNLQMGELIRTLQGHQDSINSVSISPDGQTLASGSDDETMKLWNLQTGELIRTLHGHQHLVLSVSISPDGQTLASGSVEGTVKLWNLQTGELIRTLHGHQDWVYSVSFSPDGQTLASGSSDKTVKLWNLQTGELIRTLQGHQDPVLSVSISRDGQTLASGSFDNTVKLWNLQTGELILTIHADNGGVVSVSISRDGQILASGGLEGTVKLWPIDFDLLMELNCDWVRPYLRYNPTVSEKDRKICDYIP